MGSQSLSWSALLLAVAASALILHCSLAANTIKPITYLREMQDSGDQYPNYLPKVSDPKSFSEKTVLFVFSHGAEDHELFYQHQYFTDRGVKKIDFACPQDYFATTQAVVSDFFKPSYLVKCSDYNAFDLNLYDVILIPGGLPSSGALRRHNQLFLTNLAKFYNNPNNVNKMIAAICSGTEALLSTSIMDNLPSPGYVTGSPASAVSFYEWLDKLGKPRNLYKGLDDNYKSIAYPSQGYTSHLVLGRNPDASPQFVVNIGAVLLGLKEAVPTSLSDGVPLNLVDGKYQSADFQILPGSYQLSDLPHPPTLLPQPEQPGSASRTQLLEGSPMRLRRLSRREGAGNVVNVGIALSSGADYATTKSIFDSYSQQQFNVSFICPSWVVQYKQGQVFLMSTPPSTAAAYANCQIGFDQVISGKYKFDIIDVPGGLFSTNGVLRNDDSFVQMIKSYSKSSADKQLILRGSAIELLLVSGLPNSFDVPLVYEIADDLFFGGYNTKNRDQFTYTIDHLTLQLVR